MGTYKNQESDPLQSLVSENVIQYGVLPDTIRFRSFLSDAWQVSRVIRDGLPFKFFEFVNARSPFTMMDWSRFLNISYKSLQRHKQDRTKFKPIHAEKIIEISEVVELGEDVFGDKAALKGWLFAPSYALGGERPVDLMTDSYGKQLVMDTLGRIDHGIFI